MSNLAKVDNENTLPVPDYVSNDFILNEVSPNDKEGRLLARRKIEQFQADFQSAIGDDTGSMAEINKNGLNELFAGGSYIRRLLIPKDTVIVSRIWKKERSWLIVSGEVTFTTEMGTQRVKAPYEAVIPPGSKVVLYTHEDTLWYAVTGVKNQDEYEDEVVTDNYDYCVYPWDKLEVLP